MRAGLALVEAVAALPAPERLQARVGIATPPGRRHLCPRPGRIAEAQGWPSPLSVWRVTGENPSAARFDAAHGNLPLGEWQQAEGDQRDRAAQRSLPEPDPENRAAISIRSARPPIITVMGGLAAPARQRHSLSGRK